MCVCVCELNFGMRFKAVGSGNICSGESWFQIVVVDTRRCRRRHEIVYIFDAHQLFSPSSSCERIYFFFCSLRCAMILSSELLLTIQMRAQRFAQFAQPPARWRHWHHYGPLDPHQSSILFQTKLKQPTACLTAGSFGSQTATNNLRTSWRFWSD